MGRNLRERKEELEQAKRARRRFLRNVGIGLGAAALGSLGGYIFSRRSREDERWAFLGRPNIELEKTWQTVFNDFVRLCQKVDLKSKNPPEYKKLVEVKTETINQGIREYGFRFPKIEIYGQYFGKPENLGIAERYKEYCKKAIDFLYNKVPQLERIPLDIVCLRPGQDFSQVKGGKAFIGQSWHYLSIVDVRDDTQRKGFRSVDLKSNDGSVSYTEYDNHTGERKDYFAFLSSSGNGQLGCPIIETIHLATSKAAHFYNLRGGIKRWELEEGFAHGAGRIIAEEFTEIMDVPQRQKHLKVSKDGENSSQQYELVDASEAWLRRNGIEQGLELYMEDPGKYLKVITNQ